MDSIRNLILTAQEVQSVDPTQLLTPIHYNRDNSLCVIEYPILIDGYTFNITRPSSIDPSWYGREFMPSELYYWTHGAGWE